LTGFPARKDWPFPTLRADKGSENRFIFFSGVVVPDDAIFLFTRSREGSCRTSLTHRLSLILTERLDCLFLCWDMPHPNLLERRLGH
jgi:hypothetical protein